MSDLYWWVFRFGTYTFVQAMSLIVSALRSIFFSKADTSAGPYQSSERIVATGKLLGYVNVGSRPAAGASPTGARMMDSTIVGDSTTAPASCSGAGYP